MLPKSGKPPNEAKSYRPISLLPIISKLMKRLLLKRMKPIIENRDLIPDHQFGFRCKHSTIDQVHRITDIIEKALENTDVSAAFDKVWHECLIHKIKLLLPRPYVDLLRSYLSERLFRVRQEHEYSEQREVRAGVP